MNGIEIARALLPVVGRARAGRGAARGGAARARFRGARVRRRGVAGPRLRRAGAGLLSRTGTRSASSSRPGSASTRRDGMTVADWLLTPTQILASLTRGAVFHDPDGELARRRDGARLVSRRRVALRAGGRLAQGRSGGGVRRRGPARPATTWAPGSWPARLVRELMRLAFLVERRWAPYGKWLGQGFGELRLAAELGPPLARRAERGRTWREREAMIVAAGEPCSPPPPTSSACARRSIRRRAGSTPATSGCSTRDRFTVALAAEITDPVLRGIIDRVGAPEGIPKLPGTIDQAVDSHRRPRRHRPVPGRRAVAGPLEASGGQLVVPGRDLLAGQLGDRRHDPVGGRAAGPGPAAVGRPREDHRLAEPDHQLARLAAGARRPAGSGRCRAAPPAPPARPRRSPARPRRSARGTAGRPATGCPPGGCRTRRRPRAPAAPPRATPARPGNRRAAPGSRRCPR